MHNIYFICWAKGEILVGTKNIEVDNTGSQ